MQNDTTKLQTKLSEKDFSGAQKVLSDFLAKDLSPKQKAELYLDLADTYIKASNATGEMYLQKLKTAIAHLEELKLTQAN